MSEVEFLKLNKMISTLSSLQLRIQKSGFERTAGLREAMGEDCPYYRKSLSLFMENDFQDLHSLLQKLGIEMKSVTSAGVAPERPENGS